MKHVTQEERLDYLVEEFKTDSGEYRNIETPKDTEGKKESPQITYEHPMPRNISSDVLLVQDEHSKGRSEEKGNRYIIRYTGDEMDCPSGRRYYKAFRWTRS